MIINHGQIVLTVIVLFIVGLEPYDNSIKAKRGEKMIKCSICEIEFENEIEMLMHKEEDHVD